MEITNLTEAEISSRLHSAYQEGAITSDEETTFDIREKNLQRASVLIPLAWYLGDWQVILTRRSDKVDIHSGQVSFPGGSSNREDASPDATALREAEEEIGLCPEHVHVLGRMNDILTITRFQVTPVVGVIPWPYRIKTAPDEVARVFTIPLLWLADRRNWEKTTFKPGHLASPVPVIIYHPYDGEILWGISARIILQFIAVLGI